MLRLRPLHVRLFVVDSADVVLPSACACCGALAAASTREASASGRTILVPYCSDCHFHVSAEDTRAIGAALSSSLVALAVAAALPIVWPLSLEGYVFSTFAGALVPTLVVLWPRRPHEGHSTAGRAVFFTREGRLACTSAPWADQLAAANRLTYDVSKQHARGKRLMASLGWAVAAVALALFHPVHYPVLRVLNLTDETLDVFCDGRRVATMEPTSQESPGAGVEVRVPAGSRRLSARTRSGTFVDETPAELQGRVQHLYAPSKDAYCFWIEWTTYGRRSGPEVSGRKPLAPGARFWAMPERIDTWFSPNPATAHDARSSGGRLVALRQALCPEAPAGVRGHPEPVVPNP